MQPAVLHVGKLRVKATPAAIDRIRLGINPVAEKSRARLASPQPRPTSPVNGAGGITGCRNDAHAPGVVPPPANNFCTRLSDREFRETLWSGWRCLSGHHGATDGGQSMSRLAIGIYGAIALLVTSGVAQLALGHDLSETTPAGLQNSLTDPLTADGHVVNRGSKADRATSVGGSPAQTRTISLRLDGFSDTSFLVRVPVASGNSNSSPARTKSGDRKLVLACEPVVSVLTEVAKRLQPGRCVT